MRIIKEEGERGGRERVVLRERRLSMGVASFIFVSMLDVLTNVMKEV